MQNRRNEACCQRIERKCFLGATYITKLEKWRHLLLTTCTINHTLPELTILMETFLFITVNLFGGCVVESCGVVDSGEFKHVHALWVESAAAFFRPRKYSSVPLHVSRQVVGVLVAFYQVGVARRVLIGEGLQVFCGEIVRPRLKEAKEVIVSVV